MFSKVVVGTDGSESAGLAVVHAAGVALPLGAELLVVHAYQVPPPDPGPPLGSGTAYPAAEIGRAILADAEKRLAGDAPVRTLLVEGPAADALIDVAERENAEVIVVGNVGMSGAKRLLLGSIPNRVSHHAPCHVLIVHTTGGGGGGAGMYRKVLLATDGSTTATKAVDLGAELARRVGAEVLVLHVGDPTAGADVLAQAEKLIGDGLTIETRTVSGDPAEKIIEAAEAEGVDLIVVGNKGMTGARRFLLGSVPNRVSHHAPCHVLIAKTT